MLIFTLNHRNVTRCHVLSIVCIFCWSALSITCSAWGLTRNIFACLSRRTLCCRMSVIMSWVVSRARSKSLKSLSLLRLSCCGWFCCRLPLACWLDKAAVSTCMLCKTKPLSWSSMSTKRYRQRLLFLNTLGKTSSSCREVTDWLEVDEAGELMMRGDASVRPKCCCSAAVWWVVSTAFMRSALADSKTCPLVNWSPPYCRRQTRMPSSNKYCPICVA